LEQRTAGKGLTGDKGAALLLLAIVIAAALLRFPDLDRTSLWYDEAVSWTQSRESFGALLASVAADNYPPLHNIVLWLTMPLLGDSEWALRLPSACLGVAAVALMYPIGRMLAGPAAGLLAAALLAVSPFHVWYSTEARMYALMAAAGLVFLLAVLKVLRNPEPRWLAALALSGALFLYGHIYALLGFASVGLVCALFFVTDLLRNRSVLQSAAFKAGLAMGASAILFLPWLIILAGRARSVADAGFWIAYPDLAFLETLLFGISGSLVLAWALLALSLLYLVLPQARTGTGTGTGNERNTQRRTVEICAAYTFGPPLLAYLYSVLVQPILFDRYLIAAWPGLLLLASAAAQRLWPRLGPAALFAVALSFTYPALSFTLFEKVRPEWRLVVQDFQSNRGSHDRLVLYKGFAAPALSYYLRDESAFRAVTDIETLAEDAHGEEWLLIVHSDTQEADRAKNLFGVAGASPASRRFGWGASGLSLFAPKEAR